MSDVFISHDTADKELVMQLAQQLEAAGITTWYYERDAVPGVPHTTQTGNAIAVAKATLLVLSFHSIRSYEVNTEVNWSYSEHKSFVPVLVGITWAQFAREKKDWQQLIGLSAGIEATPDNLPMVVSKIVMGLRQLELAAAARPAPDVVPADFLLLKTHSGEPAPAPRHNLPVQLTNFIGRTQQIAEVKHLLRASRLLTLIGPGGTGKTRLALQAAADSLDDFDHGAWLAELAPIADPALVPEAVAQALALPEKSGQSLQQVLTQHLRHKSLLLILDNCEHLVGACAQLVAQLLQAAPDLRILCTSREALGVAGEHSYPVPGLSLPDPRQLPPPETLAQSEAVRLFVERAQAVRLDFALTSQNALAVAQICQSLDGIPLAIELAAARARALSVEQIAARLAEHSRFRLLTGGSRTAPSRQQTLRGAIDWSYELLSERERALLRRLSVFAGSWSLEAAEEVMGGPEVLDLLTQLVAKSLVQSEQLPGRAARFRMLETIREYAQEKLALVGEDEAARRQHLDFYVSLAEHAELELQGSGQAKWLDRLDQENDNLRGALTWAIKRPEAELSLRMASALSQFWFIRGAHPEGRGWLEAALNLAADDSSLQRSPWRAKALLSEFPLVEDGEYQRAIPRMEVCLELYRELGDKSGMGFTLLWLAFARSHESAGARLLLEEAMELFETAKNGRGIGDCLFQLGNLAQRTGDRAQARQLFQRSVDILRDKGDRWGTMFSLDHLAWLAWLDGDSARALAHLEENLETGEELGVTFGIYPTLSVLNRISTALGDYPQAHTTALAIQNLLSSQRNVASARVRLGQIDYLQGRLTEAQSHFEAGLTMFQELNDHNQGGWVLLWLGSVAYRAGDFDRALSLIEEGLTITDPNGPWLDLAFALLCRGDVARAKVDATGAAEYYARSLKIVVEHRDQPDVAERLEGFAKLASAAQQPLRSSRLFGAAEALRERIGTPVPAVERADYDGAVALARASLDPAVFDAAWADGRTMGWEQAAAYALGDDAS